MFSMLLWGIGERYGLNHQNADRYMRCLMVDMDECSSNIRQHLYLILQLLTDIMCLPQRRVCIHHDIDFHEIILKKAIRYQGQVQGCPHEQGHSEAGLIKIKHCGARRQTAYMVSADGIDFLDFVAECHRLVNDKLKEIMRGRFPRQQFKLGVDSASPSHDNCQGNLWVDELQ